MWVIICHCRPEGEQVDHVDCYASSREDAKNKLREFRKQAGKGHKCVVQKMLKVDADGDIRYLS